MKKQNWPQGVDADFLTVGKFQDQLGSLRNGGSEKLARHISNRKYRLVVLDTLSRAIRGDQNDVSEMTAWLTPLQEMAHTLNSAFLLVDHHRKVSGNDPDAIGDILGSTGKGAMADTALGLYKEPQKPGARLAVVGREIEEKILELRMDRQTGCWQIEASSEGLTDQRSEILTILRTLGPARVSDIAEAVGRGPGNVYKQLGELEKNGKVIKQGKLWLCVENMENIEK